MLILLSVKSVWIGLISIVGLVHGVGETNKSNKNRWKTDSKNPFSATEGDDNSRNDISENVSADDEVIKDVGSFFTFFNALEVVSSLLKNI